MGPLCNKQTGSCPLFLRCKPKAQSKSKTFSCKWFCLTTKYFQHSTHTHPPHSTDTHTHTSVGSFCARKSPAAKFLLLAAQNKQNQTERNKVRYTNIYLCTHSTIYRALHVCIGICVCVCVCMVSW